MIPIPKYYESLGSRLGYKFFLKGSQHFGYYPNPNNINISEQKAQEYHHDILAKHLDFKPDMNILDAGCGQGFVSCCLAQKYKIHITGIDITPYVIKQAKKRSKKFHLQKYTKYVCGDYHKLPFADNSFDRVYTVETLCHAQNLPQAINELQRVLKPDGKIVFIEYTNINVNKFTTRQQKAFNIVVKGTCSPSLHLFARKSFCNILHKSGIKNIEYLDISENFIPSLERFYRIAKIPYAILKTIGAHKKFVNTVIAVEFYKMSQNNLLGYGIYSGWK